MCGHQRVIKRAHAYSNESPVIEFVPNKHFGHHTTRIAAQRRYIEEYEPEVKGQSDDRIRRFWRAYVNNMKLTKLIKVPADENGEPILKDDEYVNG